MVEVVDVVEEEVEAEDASRAGEGAAMVHIRV